MTNIAIFASGTGSNARRIMEHFRDHERVRVALVVSNKPEAGVLKIAEEFGVPRLVIDKEKFFRGDGYVGELKKHNIGFIVLAGFLWKIPQAIIDAYRTRVVNIHPALLPKYGGKGMYGNHVHNAVIAAKEKESGISIHYVDEHYDHGDLIFQEKCPVAENDTAESLAERIHQLEHMHYSRIIEKILDKG